jgi:hypothetical protein
MKSQRTRLRASIRDIVAIDTVASHTSNRDHMAMIRPCHSGDKLLRKQEVRDRIDVENIA